VKYSSMEFPKCCDLTGVLKEIWEKGWFDEYSEDHILIKAIREGKVNFRRKDEIIQESTALYQNCDNANTFISNLSFRLFELKELCTTEVLKKFIEQLAAGKQNYSEEQFFDTLHELQALHFMRRSISEDNINVVYEPQIGGVSGKKNPEYRLCMTFQIPGNNPGEIILPMDVYIFDVEVKTVSGFLDKNIAPSEPYIVPLLPIEIEKKNELKTACNALGFQLELPDIMQLKDFLNDAAKKFEIPNGNHFNVLFINWTFREIPNNYVEPYMLLNNPHNGLLRFQEIGKKFGIDDDVFNKISAIFIYSCPIQAEMFSDLRWCTVSSHSVLLNPSLSEKQKELLSRILVAPKPEEQDKLCKLISPIRDDYWLFEDDFDRIDEIIKSIMYK